MPSVYHLQPRSQYLRRLVSHGRARAGIAANQVRIAALVLSLTADAGFTLLIATMVNRSRSTLAELRGRTWA